MVGFVIVFYDDFFIMNCLLGGGVNYIVVVLIVGFIDVYVGQYVFGIGDCYCVGGNVVVDNFVNLVQRIVVNVLKQWQGFVGDIECQFCLLCCVGFFFFFNVLYQQYDKVDVDVVEDYWDINF